MQSNKSNRENEIGLVSSKASILEQALHRSQSRAISVVCRELKFGLNGLLHATCALCMT